MTNVRIRGRYGECDLCGGLLTARVSTDESPYAYRLSGLPNIELIGVQVLRCRNCGVESAVIPRIADLHRAIALDLFHESGSLTGAELRFLRKNAGFSAKEFASRIGVRPEHLSRVENGSENPLKDSTDKLARLVAMAGCVPHKELRERLLDRIEHARREKPTHAFLLKNSRWEKAA
jgi:DNA-binding transcriptional regulator YiaG